MAVIQSTQQELRYLKRKNLEEEAAVVGNWYRDIIRSYGIDCRYHKMNLSQFENFKHIIDQNTILKHAYGYDISPNYEVSANMLTYMEVENDIFQLQKFGLTPNATVNFFFDAIDFACDLATKVGQFKEYKITPKDISYEIDSLTSSIELHDTYQCDMLSGKLSVQIDNLSLDEPQSIVCHPYEHTDFFVKFPANKHLYKSLMHKICNDEYIDTYILLKYKIRYNGISKKYELNGNIIGSILFYDINCLGKYVELIHPMVGDIVVIDFPDESNREQYEITDCYDKQLTPDGISPLLHKYIWKCKAIRYINNNDDMEHNEANERMDEKIRFDDNVKEEIAKDISLYEDNEDAAYGGYDGVPNNYDKNVIDPTAPERYEFLDDHTAIDIIRFGCGSRLVTNGYSLTFVTADDKAVDIVTKTFDFHVNQIMFESGLRWLKATDDCITFVDIDGVSTKLAEDTVSTRYKLELDLDSLYDKTKGEHISFNGENYIKFTGCRSFLFATDSDLYAKTASDNQIYKLT